jgi:hypothetical protein
MKTTIIAAMMFAALAVWARQELSQDKTPPTSPIQKASCVGSDCTTATIDGPLQFSTPASPLLTVTYNDGTGDLKIEDDAGTLLLSCVDHASKVKGSDWDWTTDKVTDCKLGKNVTLDAAMTALTQAVELSLRSQRTSR